MLNRMLTVFVAMCIGCIGLSADDYMHTYHRSGRVIEVEYYDTIIYDEFGDYWVIDSEDWNIGDNVELTLHDSFTTDTNRDDTIVRCTYKA